MSVSKEIDIAPIDIEDEMKRSYLDYAMSVIVSRALPDVRDGLKPVHRRVLYAMKREGNEYNRPHRKSASAVGEVMKTYHPHGDMAIYDSIVRMAQNFSLRDPLIDGQGNFGSMDGDSAAAPRYTEIRLSKLAHNLLEDIDKKTVDFQPNYDDTTVEPKVLPARFPNLLVNGASGIAVGMATNIPPHNLGEVIDASVALIDNPELEVPDLMQFIKGPDFPTGATVMGRGGLLQAYQTGRGSVIVRAKTHIEEFKNGREAIIVTEIPYQVNKAKLVERIAELVKEKIVEGISDLRDETSREGVRIYIEIKKDSMADIVLNQLYRFSSLQTSFSFNVLALAYGKPQQLGLKPILQYFIDFREEVVTRRTRFELDKARDKAHLLLGYAVAVANIDEVITLIKTAVDRADAKDKLMARDWPVGNIAPMLELFEMAADLPQIGSTYRLTEAQTNGILDLRLHRLTGLEREKIQNDLEEVAKQIEELLSILASRDKTMGIVKAELLEVKEQFATPRITAIEDNAITVDTEDLIQKEDMVVTVSTEGYIKRVPLAVYRSQRRGGKGRSGMTTKETDVVSDVMVANTHCPILFFSSLGKVYLLKTYKLPLGSPTSKGRAMINLLPLSPGEKITTVLILPDPKSDGEIANETIDEEKYLIFATSFGHVRRNKIDDFRNIPSNGKRAMKLDDGEHLVSVNFCTDKDDMMFFTKMGACNRFNVTDVRVFAGRDSNGVRGIKMKKNDRVISTTILSSADVTTEERDAYMRMSRQLDAKDINPNETTVNIDGEPVAFMTLSQERFDELAQKEQFILTLTENGFGKRSSAYGYRTTRRGGQGIDSIIVNMRNGGVVDAFPVNNDDEVILVTDSGQMIRCPVSEIRIAGRRTQGVIVFRVAGGEKVVSVSRVPNYEDEILANEDEQDSE